MILTCNYNIHCIAIESAIHYGHLRKFNKIQIINQNKIM